MIELVSLSDTTPSAETAQQTVSGTGQSPPVSIFGIIIVGLIFGLIVGLITSPNYTIQGFFLGFAAGALITVGVYFFATERGPQPK